MKRLWLFGLIFVLASCGNSGLKDRDQFRTMLKKGEFTKAIAFVESNEFYNEEDNALLKHLELGMGHHIAGNYFQSTKHLDKAKAIHQKLFTQSLSKKAGTLITNENFDIYYGYTYERSLIHFYLSLNHFLISQIGKFEAYTAKDKDGNVKEVAEKTLTASDIQRERQAARAELLGWDSYLKDQANQKRGRSVFKTDLLAKTYGGFIHEAMGTSTDDQIALQLYKDAKKFLFQYYNAYKTFNQKNMMFRKDFSKLHKIKKTEVEKKYVNQTNYQKDLKDFLDFKILYLTRKTDGRSFNKMKRIHKPSKKVLGLLASTKNRSNLAIVYTDGLIPPKIPSKQYYGFGAVLNNPKASGAAKAAAAIGAVAVSIFAAQTLGLMPPPRSYTPIGAELGYQTARLTGEHAAIAFELPKIKPLPIKTISKLAIKDEAGKTVNTLTLPVVNPMGDIAQEAVLEDSSTKYKKLGSRLVLKHLTAIMASYATYKALKNSGKAGFLAKQAAVLQYLAASKGIEASEKADVRYWSSLPMSVRFADVYIPEGSFTGEIQEFSGKNLVKKLDIGAFQTGKGKILLSKRDLAKAK